MNKVWTELVAENPVIKDSQRTILKNLNPRNWQSNMAVSVTLVGVLYVALIGLSIQGIQFLDASLFAMILLVLSVLVPAIIVYGLIAGEKEKRTLDLLLVAPVTAPQIIVAKIIKVVVPIVLLEILLTIPAIFFTIARVNQGLPAMLNSRGEGVASVILSAMLISFCVAVFVSGLSLFISSINKSTAAALAGVLAMLFVVYVVYAVVAGVMATISPEFSNWMIGIHPFGAQANVMWGNDKSIPTWLVYFVSCFIHLGLGILLFLGATKRLDSERMKVKVKDA